MRKKVLLIYACLISLGLLYFALITFTDFRPQCASLTQFGIPCGGCGVTRMFLSMMKLDFVAAFNYNPVVFVLFFVWNAIGVLCIIDKIKFVKNPKFLYTVFALSMAAYLVLTVVRIVEYFPDLINKAKQIVESGKIY